MSKVFCVTEPLTYREGKATPMFDITPAMEYGEIEILTKQIEVNGLKLDNDSLARTIYTTVTQ